MASRRKYEYTKEEIQQLILKDIASKEEQSLEDDSFHFMHSERGDVLVFSREDYPILPPHLHAEYREDIIELLDWAIENQEMLEVVYSKSIDEKSARVITPQSRESGRVYVNLHLTLRDGVLEYADVEDFRRTFILSRIISARISRF